MPYKHQVRGSSPWLRTSLSTVPLVAGSRSDTPVVLGSTPRCSTSRSVSPAAGCPTVYREAGVQLPHGAPCGADRSRRKSRKVGPPRRSVRRGPEEVRPRRHRRGATADREAPRPVPGCGHRWMAGLDRSPPTGSTNLEQTCALLKVVLRSASWCGVNGNTRPLYGRTAGSIPVTSSSEHPRC